MAWYGTLHALFGPPLLVFLFTTPFEKMGERNKKKSLWFVNFTRITCVTYTPQNLKAFINLIYPSIILSLNGVYTSKTFVLYKIVDMIVLW